MNADALRNSREVALEALPEHLPPSVQEALREAKERLQEIYGDRLRRVILYGSQARGEAHPDSDVDVLVVLDGPLNLYAEYGRLSEVWADLFERYRLDFSFHPYDEETYQDRHCPFLRNVRAEGFELLKRHE